MRRHFQIHRLALHDLERLTAQKTRNQKLLDLRRRGHNGRKRRRRIGADRHCHLESRAFQLTQRNLPGSAAREIAGLRSKTTPPPAHNGERNNRRARGPCLFASTASCWNPGHRRRSWCRPCHCVAPRYARRRCRGRLACLFRFQSARTSLRVRPNFFLRDF